MDLKWEHGGVALGPDGLPQRVVGLEEALQNAAMAVRSPGGVSLCPELGSGLENWIRRRSTVGNGLGPWRGRRCWNSPALR